MVDAVEEVYLNQYQEIEPNLLRRLTILLGVDYVDSMWFNDSFEQRPANSLDSHLLSSLIPANQSRSAKGLDKLHGH